LFYLFIYYLIPASLQSSILGASGRQASTFSDSLLNLLEANPDLTAAVIRIPKDAEAIHEATSKVIGTQAGVKESYWVACTEEDPITLSMQGTKPVGALAKSHTWEQVTSPPHPLLCLLHSVLNPLPGHGCGPPIHIAPHASPDPPIHITSALPPPHISALFLLESAVDEDA
jgi:hypothetical protein